MKDFPCKLSPDVDTIFSVGDYPPDRRSTPSEQHTGGRIQPLSPFLLMNTQELTIDPANQSRTKLVGHRWKKGDIANPKGRPKGTRDLWPQFYEALRTVEKRKGINIFVHGWEMALKDSKLYSRMIDKLVPSLTSDTGLHPPTTIYIIHADERPDLLVQAPANQVLAIAHSDG